MTDIPDHKRNEYWWNLLVDPDQEYVTHDMVSDALEFVITQMAKTHRNRYFTWSRKIDAKLERDFMLKQVIKLELLEELINSMKFTGIIKPTFNKKLVSELKEEISDDFYSSAKTFRIS